MFEIKSLEYRIIRNDYKYMHVKLNHHLKKIKERKKKKDEEKVEEVEVKRIRAEV